jgi:hypothetical protein
MIEEEELTHILSSLEKTYSLAWGDVPNQSDNLALKIWSPGMEQA